MTYTGIVHGLPDTAYHAAAGLSSTGAKKLLKSPAHFAWSLSHPQEPKAEFDVGTATHSRVLGVGSQVEVYPDDVLAKNGSTNTNAAREFEEACRAEGKIPLKKVQYNVVRLMSESVLAHPIARALLEQKAGRPEVSVFARDTEFEIDVRCRFDFLGDIAVDLKTTSGEASPEGFARSVASFGYDVQQAHYRHTHELVTGEAPRFIFVAVEAAAPYLTSVNVLDEDFSRIGIAKARRARELYAEGVHSGTWPGYSQEIGICRPPVYSIYEFQDKYEAVGVQERVVH
jgi:hypothetical protein